ncbi:MAG: hypothetical protein Q4E53_12235 [Eubacteriales bacterium]|nr:hypothetical protein [Eubacteriales bacterium]
MRRIIINSILIVGALLLFLYGAMEYKTQYAKTEIVTYDTNKGYKLIIYMIGEPEWPFGPTKGRMELYDESDRISECNYVLHDDGCITQKDNFEVKWTEDSVVVRAMAQEQEDVYYQLYFDGEVKSWQEEALYDLPISSEEIDGCEIIRIKPFDKEMLKWTKEVVAPIGYHGINIYQIGL